MTPSTTVILGELLVEAGLPAGVVNIVLGYGQPVGAMMTTDPRVDMVTFTGSTAVGKAIVAAAAPTLKKVSLELGGKNPQVIFPDADLDSAVDAIVFGVYFNAGECCNAGSRIIVHEDIAEAVTARVVALSRKVAFGDPLDEATQVGAIISPEHQRRSTDTCGERWRRVPACGWAGRRSMCRDSAGSSTSRRWLPASRPTWRSRARRSSGRCFRC